MKNNRVLNFVYFLSVVAYRNCSVQLDNCEVIFRVNNFVVGTEDNVDVIIDTSSSGYRTWTENIGT